MDSISSQIEFVYHFTTDESYIPKKWKKDSAIVLRVDGDFEIKVDGRSYCQEYVALLEFYLYLHRWLAIIESKKYIIPEFHYYSLEWHEDEPLISIIPFDNNDKARLTSIWRKEPFDPVFKMDYIVNQLTELRDQLKKDIETHYSISVEPFIDKFPIRALAVIDKKRGKKKWF
ncbi:hypothetical protein P4U23_00085 [Aeribacillus composti]|uniref:DUF7878 domain-containing protein n=1 Tax=Aeribacillus composti TaxID=1868734 RepID=UPI002E1CE4AF|nr:hypothetical protein [Aeribacillus composti]